jgi:hypothetical protein
MCVLGLSDSKVSKGSSLDVCPRFSLDVCARFSLDVCPRPE